MDQDAGFEPCRRSTMPSKSRCKRCYQRERKKDPTAKSSEIKKRCANPTNGCIVCYIYICTACWPLHVEDVKERRARGNSDDTPLVYQESLDFRSGSVVMESLLATNDTNWNDFFENKWEKNTRLFSYDADITTLSQGSSPAMSTSSVSSVTSETSISSVLSIPPRTLIPAKNGGDGQWRETSMVMFPLRETIRQGWHILTTLMGVNNTDDGSMADNIGNYCHRTMTKISILQNSRPKTRDEIKSLYNGDLYSCYLAGCSIVWENCDLLSPHIAALCQDLQGEQDRKAKTQRGGAFREAKATAYLTPPYHSEITPENTNDRNVLIFQLVGRKYWKTSWKMLGDPPETALDTSITPSSRNSSSFEGFLYPGDILYIPKGMFYQTLTTSQIKNNEDAKDEGKCQPSISFDVTVALDKSDELFDKTIGSTVSNRPPVFTDVYSSTNTETNVVAESEKQHPKQINSSDHNVEFSTKRTLLIKEAKRTSPDWRAPKKGKYNSEESRSVSLPTNGSTAVSDISFHTVVRSSTQDERKYSQSHTKDSEERATGIRRELRDVAKVVVARFQSLITGDETVVPLNSTKIGDLIEVVKSSFGGQWADLLICDLTILILVKREVEAGYLAVVHSVESLR